MITCDKCNQEVGTYPLGKREYIEEHTYRNENLAGARVPCERGGFWVGVIQGRDQDEGRA